MMEKKEEIFNTSIMFLAGYYRKNINTFNKKLNSSTDIVKGVPYIFSEQIF